MRILKLVNVSTDKGLGILNPLVPSSFSIPIRSLA